VPYLGNELVMRLCRLPCGKPLAFRLLIRNKERLRLGRPGRQNVAGLTESQRLSAREAAQPHTHHKVSFSYLLAEQKEALW